VHAYVFKALGTKQQARTIVLRSWFGLFVLFLLKSPPRLWSGRGHLTSAGPPLPSPPLLSRPIPSHPTPSYLARIRFDPAGQRHPIKFNSRAVHKGWAAQIKCKACLLLLPSAPPQPPTLVALPPASRFPLPLAAWWDDDCALTHPHTFACRSNAAA